MKVPVTFGETTYQISRLNLGQIERISPLATKLNANADGAVTGVIEILTIAMERDYPDLVVRDLEASLTELKVGLFDILRNSGLDVNLVTKAPSPGEVEAS